MLVNNVENCGISEAASVKTQARSESLNWTCNYTITFNGSHWNSDWSEVGARIVNWLIAVWWHEFTSGALPRTDGWNSGTYIQVSYHYFVIEFEMIPSLWTWVIDTDCLYVALHLSHGKFLELHCALRGFASEGINLLSDWYMDHKRGHVLTSLLWDDPSDNPLYSVEIWCRWAWIDRSGKYLTMNLSKLIWFDILVVHQHKRHLSSYLSVTDIDSLCARWNYASNYRDSMRSYSCR